SLAPVPQRGGGTVHRKATDARNHEDEMTVNSVSGAASANAARPAAAGRGFDTLGQADFLRLLTVQIQQQDPFDPADNKEMLAQLSLISSLSCINDVKSTLRLISSKLDALAPKTASE